MTKPAGPFQGPFTPLPFSKLLLCLTLLGWIWQPTQGWAQNQEATKPPLPLLKKLFPNRTITADNQDNYRSWLLDMNGDGQKEWVVVENPNKVARARFLAAKKRGCLCPLVKAPKVPAPTKVKKSTKKSKKKRRKKRKRSVATVAAIRSKLSRTAALYDVLLLPQKRRLVDVKIIYDGEKAPKRSFEEWMSGWIGDMGLALRRSRKWRRWGLRRLFVTDAQSGRTASASFYNCKRLARYSQKRRLKKMKRWVRQEEAAPAKRCPCSKEQLKAKRPSSLTQPLQIVVARVLPKKQATDPKGVQVVGRLKGTDLQLVPLTRSNDRLAIRIAGKMSKGFSGKAIGEALHIYDTAGSHRLHRIFQIQTSRSMDDKDTGGRAWKRFTLADMDSDEWKELIVDSYYENSQFTGRIHRQLYKWHRGKYRPMNEVRGVIRASASGTWKRQAPKGSKQLQRLLAYRVRAENVIDGFLGTSWVAGKLRRSIGDWIRVELAGDQTLLGVAISVKAPTRAPHVVRDLSTKEAPALTSPRYLKLTTSRGLELPITLTPGQRFHFVRLPPGTSTSFLKLTLIDRYSKGKTRLPALKIPPKERSLGFIAEIVPIQARVRYTSSSMGSAGISKLRPEFLGDNDKGSAWGEGRRDNGEGEWVQMVFPMPKQLTALQVVNGCQRPGERYILNNRIKEAVLTFSDGSTQKVTLKDSHKPQQVKVRPVRTMSVKLTIRSVYKGKLGHLTCLSTLKAP